MAIGAGTHFYPSTSRTSFFSGFGGRVRGIKYTAANDAPLDSVALGIGPAAVLMWVKSWNCEISADIFGADTFMNPMNRNGKPFKMKDLVGLASGKVDLDGWTISGGNLVTIGMVYGLELCLGASAPTEYRKILVYGLCSSVSRSAAADGNSPIEYKCSFEFASPPGFVADDVL